MMDDFPSDDIRPFVWLDAFPWIKGAAEPDEDPWWNDAIEDATVAVRRKRLARISELAMARLTRWTVGQILPGLDPELDLEVLPLPTRAVNALGRHDCLRAAKLSGITLVSMMEWQNVGVGTVDAILQALADASTSLETPKVTTAHNDRVTQAEVRVEARLPDWVASMIDDLTQVATWYATVGLPGRTLLAGELPVGTPDEIIQARARLDELSADDILDESQLEMDVAGLLDDALAMLNPKAVTILAERLFADDPVTLDQLGRDQGVTRERIRQIEGKARAEMLSCISDGSSLELVAGAARTLIGTILPLDDLLQRIPSLGKWVDLARQPAWRVLDRLDDAYEIEDGWCVAPTMTSAQTLTQTQLQERADRYGVVRIDELDLIETSEPERRTSLTRQWLAHCGYVIEGDFVLTRTQRMQDYGAAVLAVVGSPLSAQEITDRFAFERSAGSLRNAMSMDDRFERVDRDKWALTEWGMDAYSGIRSLIRERVAWGGGRVKLDELIEYITGRYSVTASSVTAYASSPPFELREGFVRVGGGDARIRKTPERTRRLFRRPDAWAYRIRITPDHLRGSGSSAPIAIAAITGLQFGQSRQLESRLGPQAIAWTGSQPMFGTIRRFLIDGDIPAGTEALLIINDDGTFDFEPVREPVANPLLDALSLIGAPPIIDLEKARLALAKAICLPEASPVTSIIGGYRERGDSDVADLMTEVREYLESGSSPETRANSATVEDILDLL